MYSALYQEKSVWKNHIDKFETHDSVCEKIVLWSRNEKGQSRSEKNLCKFKSQEICRRWQNKQAEQYHTLSFPYESSPHKLWFFFHCFKCSFLFCKIYFYVNLMKQFQRLIIFCKNIFVFVFKCLYFFGGQACTHSTTAFYPAKPCSFVNDKIDTQFTSLP